MIGRRPYVDLTEGDSSSRQALLIACGAAVSVGVLVAATPPIAMPAALAGLAILALIVARPVLGVLAFVAVIATLPFGVIPVQIGGAQLTFVDAVLIATFGALLARVLFGQSRLNLSMPGPLLVAFVGLACIAFAVGGAANPIPPELIRRYGKLLASLLFFVVARSLITTRRQLTGLTQALIVAGALQGAIAAVLMALAPNTQLALLSQLTVIGYPSSDILRYVPGPNDTYTSQLRAIGTSVDPNVLGGTLMLALVLMIVQWASRRPVLPRLLLLLLAVPTAAGVVLSLSRASWLGLACGLALAGALRYRRIVVFGLLAALAVLVTPFGQDLVVRFVTGFSAADRATAFRLGEYFNAFVLIQRYPLLGIGFGLSPDIDVTAGVSSVYLLVAEQSGLIGLVLYVAALAGVWSRGARRLASTTDETLSGVRIAYLAAVSGALVTGFLDHYFANISFPHAVALFWLYAAALVVAADFSGVTPRQAEGERAAPTGAETLGRHAAPV